MRACAYARVMNFIRSYAMNAKKKTAAVALAAVFACGALAGCDALTVHNLTADYGRTVATVDISASDSFKEGGIFEGIAEVVGESSIVKRDLVLSFLSNGASLVQSYGMSVEEAFDYLLDNLIQRQAYVQYAKAYLLKNGSPNEEETYSIDAYKTAVAAAGANATDAQKKAAGLGYFLTQAEKDKALYDLRVSINSAIDSQEEGLIAAKDDHDHTADSDVRAIPTGAETVSEDFYDTAYRIYTGKETALGTYEKLEGSTVATRKAAYNSFITNLYSGEQLKKGEDTTKLETTDYFYRQLVSQYESSILAKLGDKFEQEAIANLAKGDEGNSWAKALYDEAVANQKAEFGNDKSAFEDAFNAISDSSFVFAPYDYGYGYVLNILLPFSTLQTEELNSFTNDYGDAKGGKFAARARLLQNVKAADQRSTWFTGHDDYSYEAEEGYGIGVDSARKYLFFENSFTKSDDEKDGDNVVKTAQYDKIKNYYGKYSYNGTVDFDEDGHAESFDPARIGIDGFLNEMKNYMKYADQELEFIALPEYNNTDYQTGYFTRENFYYTEGDNKGEVNYDQFIYEVGKVSYFTTNDFDPNDLFVAGSPENTAFSVMNELSFAYNTDTAGLNSYLGYMISPYQTSYMKEFEHAAQLAVSLGAGSYVVVPTDYGWHIIYCTFSFADVKGEKGDGVAFTFDQSKAEGGAHESENSFSWLFFEQLKSQVVDAEVSRRQSDILAEYAEACSTKFEYVYRDLLNL